MFQLGTHYFLTLNLCPALYTEVIALCSAPHVSSGSGECSQPVQIRVGLRLSHTPDNASVQCPWRPTSRSTPCSWGGRLRQRCPQPPKVSLLPAAQTCRVNVQGDSGSPSRKSVCGVLLSVLCETLARG